MQSSFDLYKALAILSFLGFTVALLGSLDYAPASTGWQELIDYLKGPLQLSNWHYFLLIYVILIRK